MLTEWKFQLFLRYVRYDIWCLNRTLWFYVPFENFSIIWRRHHYRWRASYFDLYSALMVIEQWGFLSVPHLLWHAGYPFIMVISEDPWHSHLLRSVEVYRGWDSNIQPSAREANALMDCATAADWIELNNVLILIGSQVHWFSLTYECENQWKVYQIYPKHKFWIDFIYWLCNNANYYFMKVFIPF